MILGITVFLVVNTYYDGKYTKMLSINQKYFKMAMFGFVGFSMYLLIKKNPSGSKSMLQHAILLLVQSVKQKRNMSLHNKSGNAIIARIN